MNVWKSKTYIQDLQDSIRAVDWSFLNGASVLVTGATGLIGSAFVDMMVAANRTFNTKITIYTASRTPSVLQRFPEGSVTFLPYDATETLSFDVSVDYIVHCASNASPDKYVTAPVDTMLANVMGVHQLLLYARRYGIRKFMYVSSSEVYGKQTHGRPMVEDEYGNVDILSVRSSYSIGKQAAETMCISHAAQYGIPVSIVRPGHIYGPTAQRTDRRISSDFAFLAAEGKPLVMKSAGSQIRSYCHCLDCASAMFRILEKGVSGEAYNISNRDSIITIRQMAELLSACAGVPLVIDMPSDAEMQQFNPMDNSSLNSEKLEQLGWTGLFPAQQGLDSTIRCLKELKQAGHW